MHFDVVVGRISSQSHQKNAGGNTETLLWPLRRPLTFAHLTYWIRGGFTTACGQLIQPWSTI